MSDAYTLYRLDSRLVHGQVCTAWIPQMNIKRVVIVHDEYAKDSFIVDLHRSVVPAGVVCDTISTEDAVAQWKETQFKDQNTLIIFQTTALALNAYKAGMNYNELQVATLAGTSNSYCVYKQVNVTRESAVDLLELIGQGVDVYCQMFASDARSPMKALLEQKKCKAKLKL